MKVVKNMLAGLVIGIANIIPGVSGGTMMVILNVFDKIVGAVSDFRKNPKKNALFLLQILAGAVIGIVLFSKAITYMLLHHAMITNFFFLGLIVGSVPLVLRNAFAKSDSAQNQKHRINISSIVVFLICFLLLVVIAFFPAEETLSAATVTIDFPMILRLFFGGALAAIAMIIPGVSGSFVMVLLGIYSLVAGAASVVFPIRIDQWIHVLLPIGIPAGLGILLGLIIGSKVINLLLKHFNKQTYFGILGLLLGSLFDIYPGFTFNMQGLLAVLVAIFGFLLAFLSSSTWVESYFRQKNA